MNKSKNVKGLIYSFLSFQELVQKISILSKSEREFLVDKKYYQADGEIVVNEEFVRKLKWCKSSYEYVMKLAKKVKIITSK